MFRGGRVGGFSVGLGEQMGAGGGAQHGVGMEPLSQSGHFTDVEREAQRGQWSCPRTHSKQTAQPGLVLRLAVQSAPCLPTVFLRFEVSHLLSCSVVSDSFQPHGPYPARLLCPWDFPGKNTGVGYHSLLQGIFLIQGSNPCLLHGQAYSFPLSHLESLGTSELQQGLCQGVCE